MRHNPFIVFADDAVDKKAKCIVPKKEDGLVWVVNPGYITHFVFSHLKGNGGVKLFLVGGEVIDLPRESLHFLLAEIKELDPLEASVLRYLRSQI